VEEAELTRLYDPLLQQGDEAAKAESTVVFREVETAQAMLTISAWDVDIPLGTSVAYDVATLFTEHNQQSIGSKEAVVTELSVPILPQSSSAPSPPETSSAETAPAAETEKEVTPAETEKEDTAAETEKEEEKEVAAGEEAVAGEEANEAAPEPSPAPESSAAATTETTTTTTTAPTTSGVSEAVCTVTLRISYQPSVQDQRDALYEQLNVVSQKKAAAVEELRQVALAASRQQLTTSSSSGNEPPTKKPAIQAGFLNRSSNKADKAAREADTMWSRLQAWYERTLGPESLVRRVAPVAKNYVIFFGVVTFFHFQGQQLALPPPV